MEKFSYIGICDFPNGEQSLRSAQLFRELCETYAVKDRKLMIGVMMSFRTLTGARSKWTDVFPRKEDLAGIFVDHPVAFNTLHFADYDCHTSTAHLIEAAEWAGPFCDAIQLDMIWPPDVITKGLRRKFPNIKIVLQINRHSLLHVSYQPVRLVEQLKMYDGLLDWILLDESIGEGSPIKPGVLMPLALAVAEHLPHIGIAGAGGLGPGTVKRIEPLKKVIPSISWDAQGKLRPSGNTMDPINWSMADQYLLESVQLCS